MRAQRVLSVSLVCVLIVGTVTAYGDDPQLLATWNATGILGSPEIYDSRWPVFAFLRGVDEITAPLFEDLALSGPFPQMLDDTVSSASDADFDEFVSLLTDGISFPIATAQWSDSGLIGGGWASEEQLGLQFVVPQLGPDLVGYEVESIRQILTVDIDSPGSDPYGDGVWTDWSVTGHYEFYGSLVPEPSTVLPLALGFAGLLLGRGH